MGSMRIVVGTDQILVAVNRIEESMEVADKLTQQMLEEVRDLASIWEGDAASAYISKFNMEEDDINKMISIFREDMDILRRMADLYVQAENDNQAEIQALKDCVLE